MPDQNQQITRLRPWDLTEVITKYGDLALSEVITAMQEADNRSYTCPKCLPTGIELDPKPTGQIEVVLSDSSTVKAVCDICEGYLKTSVQYVADPNKLGNYIPYLELPEVNPELLSSSEEV
jgi:hypothetical protein